MALVCGCASTNEMATWWPWHQPDQSADLARYGPVSWQKIEQLKELRKLESAAIDESALAGQFRSETDPLVRLEIVRTLAHVPTPTAGAVIAAALQDPDVDVRVTACQEIGKIGGEQASRLLGETLAGDTSVDVRIAATKALGQMRDPQAVPLLVVALEDPDPALQLRGMEAMRLASGKDLGNDVNRWREYALRPDPDAPEESLAAKMRRLF
jgi:HEAT repeat protein